MFGNCERLIHLPNNFNLPQNITSVGNDFCDYMFERCYSLNSLPNNFNLPQNIITVGTYFCYDMFQSCEALTRLPNNFNLPQNITTYGVNFCRELFYYCISLEYGAEAEGTFIYLPDTGYPYNEYYYMFSGCTKLNNDGGFPITPSANTS
jgi:hypothetical protein